MLRLRRAAAIGAGLVMTVSVGLAAAEAPSAASTALHIKNDSKWTMFPMGGGCEVVTFNAATSTFTSDYDGDSGTWSGGGSTIHMVWTAGPGKKATFKGSFVNRPKPVRYYTGTYTYQHFNQPGSNLNKGVWKGC
jgi:hypothetical protein